MAGATMRWATTARWAAGISLLSVLGLAPVGLASRSQTGVHRVMIVVLENSDYAEALAQPFLAQLAREGALLRAFFAVSHPSQPNYVAMTSGALHGVSSNDSVTLDVRHVGDLLEARGRTWKVYAEQYPGSCFRGPRSGGYVRRHVPFLSFRNVVESPDRCHRIVDASMFMTDLRHGTLPNYALYVPDVVHDGHDSGVREADRWLAKTFGPLLKDPRLMRDLLLVVTFDEGRRSGDNHIYTVLYGDAVVPGSVSDLRYDHYSLLRTIEEWLDVGSLGEKDATATPIGGIWR